MRKQGVKKTRPCLGCKDNYYIYDKNNWLCEDCFKKKKEERAIKLSGDVEIKGLTELFLEVWEERPHYCQECRRKGVKNYLGEVPLPIFFSHIKSRGAYPELRLEKTNIELLCSKCHYKYDFGDRNK